jgi:hypothetical protein
VEQGDREVVGNSQRHSTDGVAEVKAGAFVGQDVRRRASLPAMHSPSTHVILDPPNLKDAPSLAAGSAIVSEGLSEIDKDIEVQTWLNTFEGFSSSSEDESSDDSEIVEFRTEADADAARTDEKDNARSPGSIATSNGGTNTHSNGGFVTGTHPVSMATSRSSFETGKSWGRPEKSCPSEMQSKVSMAHESNVSLYKMRSAVRCEPLFFLLRLAE